MQNQADLATRIAAIEARLQELKSIGTPGNYTSGGILFGSTDGKAGVDGANLFWDNANDRLGLGTNAPNTRLDIRGTNASYGSGPHIDFTTSADAYPELQILPYSHDNINITFDGKFDGTNWKSSDAGSNFQIRKSNDILGIWYNAGTTAGNNITTWNETLGITNDNFVRLGGLGIRITALAFTLANNAVSAIGLSNFCFLFMHGGATPAIYTLNGASHTTTELNDPFGTYTVTAGTASSTNIYWSAGNSRYEIENKRGATVTTRIWVFDAP